LFLYRTDLSVFYSRLISNALLARDVSRFKRLQFREDIYFADFDQYLIRYRLCGQGSKCVVIVPSGPNMIEHYDRIADLLSPDFKVLIFELPGFGFSLPKKVTYDYSLQSCSEITIKLLDYLGIKSCVLSIPCVNGFISLKIAELRPDLVSNIVCIQTICWEDKVEWFNQMNKKIPVKSSVWGQPIFNIFKYRMAETWYQRAIENPGRRAIFTRITLDNFKKGAKYAVPSMVQAMFRSGLPQLQPTDIETLVIWGNKDQIYAGENEWGILMYFSNFEPHEFEEEGHYPELEHPERYARLIKKQFLAAPALVD